MKDFISIDPGTWHTGCVLWQDGKPVAFKQIDVPRKQDMKDDAWLRIQHVLGEIAMWLSDCDVPHIYGIYKVFSVAVETHQGIATHQSRYMLDWLIGALYGRFGFQSTWFTYHPSTVQASAVLRGMKRNKVNAMEGMSHIYPEFWTEVFQVCAPGPDVIDALAIGYCHLVKIQEAQVIADAT